MFLTELSLAEKKSTVKYEKFALAIFYVLFQMKAFWSTFFSINMYYLINKYFKYSSLFDAYLTKWRKNEKYNFYIN